MTEITIRTQKNGRQKVAIDGTTVKVGAKSKPAPIGVVLGTMDKGKARHFRKQLRKAGCTDLAAAKRIAA